MKTAEDFKKEMIDIENAYEKAVQEYLNNSSMTTKEDIKKLETKYNIAFTNWMSTMEYSK